jgi:hypothetical protein
MMESFVDAVFNALNELCDTYRNLFFFIAQQRSHDS